MLKNVLFSPSEPSKVLQNLQSASKHT